MAGFRKLGDNLGRLAQIPSRIAAPVAARITEELKAQFLQGSDPYGDPWEDLEDSTVRRKKGDDRILCRTDELASTTVAVPSSSAGIELRTEEFAKFHQRGTRNMVRRAVLPDRGDLPQSWQNAIGEEYSRAFKKAVG